MTSPGLATAVERSPGPEQVAEILALLAVATAADGVAPVSEPTLLDLRRSHDPAARHLLARREGELAGYARLDATGSGELVVHPGHRRRGVGTVLLGALEEAAPDRRPPVWAHGRLPAAAGFADANGYAETRVLWRLGRSLADPIPGGPLPPGIHLRAFEPGRDEETWVAVNARAFSDHPEQGAWTVEDLELREAEPWFDPAGFLLAVRDDGGDGSLAGFHWTKVHVGDPPIGEVYVLGVDPSARGTRLGPALTAAGLRYLRDVGLTDVMLYVDDDNRAAMRLYEGFGFRKWDVDVQYRRTGTGA